MSGQLGGNSSRRLRKFARRLLKRRVMFTRTHAGKTVTSKDFQRAIKQASQRDLSALFALWVYPA